MGWGGAVGGRLGGLHEAVEIPGGRAGRYPHSSPPHRWRPAAPGTIKRRPSLIKTHAHARTLVPTEESRESLTRDLAAPEQLPKLRRMAQIMLDAAYDPVKAGYVAARERALAAALRAAGPEAPAPGALAALAPDALERAVAAWGRRLRAVALLALRCARGRRGALGGRVVRITGATVGRRRARPGPLVGSKARGEEGKCRRGASLQQPRPDGRRTTPAPLRRAYPRSAPRSERRLARGVWPEPESGELFVAAVGRQLRALLQAGRDIVEARRAPEKVRPRWRCSGRTTIGGL